MNIRRAVFETNSSSSHSITIVGGTYRPDRLHAEDGVVTIYGGKFGWGVEQFNDAATKASYCLVYAHGPEIDLELDGKTGESIETRREPTHPELLERLRQVIASETGCEVEFNMRGGYIDHQSNGEYGTPGVCAEAFKTDETLRDFIFNPKSRLLIDNDNH